MNKEVHCNRCGEDFYENDLALLNDSEKSNPLYREDFYKGCPNCKTDCALVDIDLEHN